VTTTVRRAQGVALARAALAGNPSDGYGGAVLAVTLSPWAARAEAVAAPTAGIDPASARAVGVQPPNALVEAGVQSSDALVEVGVEPPNALVEAAVRRFAREFEPAGLGTTVRWRTSIPQRVGLGSSSALVIAVARALSQLHGVSLTPAELAEFALAVETEDLGIVAGLQDRVAQAFEGLTFMDFGGASRGGGRGSYEALDPRLLPPMVIAWRRAAAGHSGDVHGSLRERYDRGEGVVRETMAELAGAARGARDALLAGDVVGFAACVDRTFDLRRRVISLDPRCVEMIELARSCGAGANYTGSGGAIVAVCPESGQVEEVERALSEASCEVVRRS
jgi:galactokinase/mevalonate kinase-like predicted kinase